MTAALATTLTDLTAALERVTRPKTIADVARWGIPLGKYRHFAWAVEALTGMGPNTPLDAAKARLAKRIEDQINAHRRKHWSADGRLGTFHAMLRHIEEFEEDA